MILSRHLSHYAVSAGAGYNTITRRHECLICGLVAPDHSQLFDRLWLVHHSPGIGNQCLYHAKMEKL